MRSYQYFSCFDFLRYFLSFKNNIFSLCGFIYSAQRSITRTFPVSFNVLCLGVVVYSVCVILVLGIYHKSCVDEQEANVRSRIQSRFDGLIDDIAEQLDFAAKVFESGKLQEPHALHTQRRHERRHISPSITLGMGHNLPSFSLEDKALVLNRVLQNNTVVSARVPYHILSYHIGISHLTNKNVYSGVIQTKVGILHYPHSLPSFRESFLREKGPYALILIGGICAAIFIFQSLYAFCVIRARAAFKDDLRLAEIKISDLSAEKKRLAEENDTLKKDMSLKSTSHRLLASLRRTHQDRQSEQIERSLSCVTLLKHALKKAGSNNQVIELASEIQKAIAQDHSDYNKHDLDEIDIFYVLENVKDILGPLLTRSGILWLCDLEKNELKIATDPYLFQICLLAICKDLATHVFEGSTLHVSSMEQGLVVNIIGTCLATDTPLCGEEIDLGFMYITHAHLASLIKTLGMRLSKTKYGFELHFNTKSFKESTPHDNVIPLFA